jgi:hypothetical protein
MQEEREAGEPLPAEDAAALDALKESGI